MSCPSGQTVVGTSITYCNNAAWSPALGSCSGSGSSVGQASTSFPSTTTTCSFLPIAPPYGRIVTSQTSPFPDGTDVTLQCDDGYQIQGQNATSRCANGVFTEMTATCTK
uniref:Sushi domain-containing protein n=1 Tax=Caenorhabditis tropicalis TaxID=1561998 RepID=A0A1I7UIZ6_9PELO